MENKKNNISRRDFLKRLGMGTASALALSAAGPLHSFAREKKIYQDATNNMTYRLSRNTGAKVSLLGFGMMRLPMTPDRKIDQEKVNEMVDYAMEHGVNYYDTSPHYGMHQSERATGNALKKYPRESFNLCTKMSSYLDQDGNSREVAEAGYRKSFEECQVEYFDYYLIHGAGIGGMERLHSNLLDNGMLDFLLEERKKGKIRNLGFSFHGDLEVFKYLLQLHDEGKAHWDLIQIQMNYKDWKHASGWNTNAEYLYGECEKRGIQNTVMEPLFGGALAKLPTVQEKKLTALRPNDSVASWSFRFVGGHNNVLSCLSGMTRLEHVIDNVKTFSPVDPCTVAELELLEQIAIDLTAYPTIDCTACRYCMPCPYGVDIPGNFAFYNKAVNEGTIPPADKNAPDFAERSKTFAAEYGKSMDTNALASACVGCEACLTKCPQRIQIPLQMQRLTEMLDYKG